MATKIQFRRDTAANWSSVNPILSEGELGLVTDTGAYKIGDGSSAWNSLGYTVLSGEFTGLLMDEVATPSTPVSTKITSYHGIESGRPLPSYIDESGVASALSPFWGSRQIGIWVPPGNANAVPGVLGYGTATVQGASTARTIAATNLFTRQRRLGYVSSAVAGSFAGNYQPTLSITTGNGAGLGGFHKVIQFGISDAASVAGARMFVGVVASTAAMTNVEPSTLINCIGVGHGAADTNLKLFYGGSTAQTPIDLGANFPATTLSTDLYELCLYSPSHLDMVVKYRVVRLNTGDVATGTLTGSGGVALPSSTTLLSMNRAARTNNATALAVGLDIVSDYVETWR